MLQQHCSGSILSMEDLSLCRECMKTMSAVSCSKGIILKWHVCQATKDTVQNRLSISQALFVLLKGAVDSFAVIDTNSAKGECLTLVQREFVLKETDAL